MAKYALVKDAERQSVKPTKNTSIVHLECGEGMKALDDGRYFCAACSKAGYLLKAVK